MGTLRVGHDPQSANPGRVLLVDDETVSSGPNPPVRSGRPNDDHLSRLEIHQVECLGDHAGLEGFSNGCEFVRHSGRQHRGALDRADCAGGASRVGRVVRVLSPGLADRHGSLHLVRCFDEGLSAHRGDQHVHLLHARLAALCDRIESHVVDGSLLGGDQVGLVRTDPNQIQRLACHDTSSRCSTVLHSCIIPLMHKKVNMFYRGGELYFGHSVVQYSL